VLLLFLRIMKYSLYIGSKGFASALIYVYMTSAVSQIRLRDNTLVVPFADSEMQDNCHSAFGGLSVHGHNNPGETGCFFSKREMEKRAGPLIG
jgi:hypothetical protein